MGGWKLRMTLIRGLICLTMVMGACLLLVTARQPAQFIFGDSLVDSGNNNYLLASLAKANFMPNGIDRPDHEPTGRFCNNASIPDLIGTVAIIREFPILSDFS